jgi:sec-independent protein translocase protein TatA
MNLGLPEIIVLFCVALLVFGPKRLPDLAQALGKGIRDFKRAMNGEDEEKPQNQQQAPRLQSPPENQPTYAQGSQNQTNEPVASNPDEHKKQG